MLLAGLQLVSRRTRPQERQTFLELLCELTVLQAEHSWPFENCGRINMGKREGERSLEIT